MFNFAFAFTSSCSLSVCPLWWGGRQINFETKNKRAYLLNMIVNIVNINEFIKTFVYYLDFNGHFNVLFSHCLSDLGVLMISIATRCNLANQKPWIKSHPTFTMYHRECYTTYALESVKKQNFYQIICFQKEQTNVQTILLMVHGTGALDEIGDEKRLKTNRKWIKLRLLLLRFFFWFCKFLWRHMFAVVNKKKLKIRLKFFVLETLFDNNH